MEEYVSRYPKVVKRCIEVPEKVEVPHFKGIEARKTQIFSNHFKIDFSKDI